MAPPGTYLTDGDALIYVESVLNLGAPSAPSSSQVWLVERTNCVGEGEILELSSAEIQRLTLVRARG